MLNAVRNFFGRKGTPPGAVVNSRESAAQGPYTQIFNDYVPRLVAPRLYEAMREAAPPLDGAVNRLVTLDGVLTVQGDNAKLVSEIEDFVAEIPVGDLHKGMQAFFNLMSNERYEQGFAMGEMVQSGRRGEIERLWVGDSKGFYFQRPNGKLKVFYSPPAASASSGDGQDQIERILRNNWRSSNIIDYLNASGYNELDRSRLIYVGLNNENDNPYGVSLFRSTEFATKALLTITNAVMLSWQRFGDPMFKVVYKGRAKAGNGKTADEIMETRRKSIADIIQDAMNIKKQGNSADIVTAIDKDAELSIEILGSDGQILEVEAPVKHIMEQIVAKLGLPPWMLGFVWGTAERLADRQVDLIIQESRTRFASWKPYLKHIIETELRARGRAWKKGDWDLVQELPNLKDELAQAQAEFMRAQSEAVSSGRGLNTETAKVFNVDDKGEIKFTSLYPIATAAEKAHQCKTESYVEDEENLMRLERKTEKSLTAAWGKLYDATVKMLGLSSKKGAKEPAAFIFDFAVYQALLDLQAEFVAKHGGENSTLATSEYAAWLRGVENAAKELDADAITDAARAQAEKSLTLGALENVRNITIRAYGEDVVRILASGAFNGQNPMDVARELRKRFDAHEYDWVRLARSEIAQAQSQGKLEQYVAQEIEQYDWVQAGGACPICNGLAAAGPYSVGAGPMPMRDSHPNCRCTIAAVV